MTDVTPLIARRAGRDELPLSEYLWRNAADIVQEARYSTFIAGIREGSLDPNYYGKYMVQDAVFCREVADVWKELSVRREVPAELRAVAKRVHVVYWSASRKLLDAWNIEEGALGHYGVLLGSAAEKYRELVRRCLDTEEAQYMLIVSYPCYKLWAEMAKEVASLANSKEVSQRVNLYNFWVDKNNTDKYSKEHANLIDMWDVLGWFQRDKALHIFRQAMKAEVDFFNMVEDTGASPSTLIGTNGRPFRAIYQFS